MSPTLKYESDTLAAISFPRNLFELINKQMIWNVHFNLLCIVTVCLHRCINCWSAELGEQPKVQKKKVVIKTQMLRSEVCYYYVFTYLLLSGFACC